MKKFKFRLEKVLEYRAMAEQWAKEAFLAAKLATFEGEGELEDIRYKRAELLKQPVGTIDEHRAIEQMLAKSDDDERDKLVQLETLRIEENEALEQWKTKRQELEALNRLKEEALAAWEMQAGRKEQEELDEWTSMRRAA